MDKNNYHLFDIINKNIAIYETIDGKNFIFKDLNKFAEITENVKRENIIGKNVIDVFPGVIDFGLLEVFKRVYQTGISENFPLKMYSDNRITGWRENYVHKLPDGKIVAIYDDLTKMKQLEESLKQSEEQFRAFFENNRAVILKINTKNKQIIDCNKTAVNYYGYTKEELTSKTIDELNTLSIKEINIKMSKAIKEKSNRFHFQHKLANGEIRDIELYSSPIKVKNEIYLFTIIHDITDRIKAEKAYIENQRLSAVGEMAAAIAHDFNNSLQGIGGNIELCLYEHNNMDTELYRKLKIIESEINDASNRVKSLLKFSGHKNQETDKEVISINSILDDIIFQARPLWKTKVNKEGLNIDIIKDYKDFFYIKGNKGLISSALFNLLKNSIEAMPKGGTITFSITKIDNKIHLIIKDTGIGMNEDTKIRIFQPFFSTKGLEIGRGLGMSGVYSIIKEHNGSIKVKETKINYGTSIEIILPIAKKNENENIKKENNKLANKNSRILWVDDDKIISLLAKRYLNALQYAGDAVTNGFDALELLKINKYDILITDIGMPEMNGWQLIDKIRNELKNTEIKIILLSGWETNEEELLKKYNISNILQKPIMINDLKELLN